MLLKTFYDKTIFLTFSDGNEWEYVVEQYRNYVDIKLWTLVNNDYNIIFEKVLMWE